MTLWSQGLLHTSSKKGKDETLRMIEHLGYIQIDTLSVVARAHHHTLWTRLRHYREEHLKELLEKDKTIYEYWSHAASYLPMNMYRFSLPQKKLYSEGKDHWFAQDKKIKKYVLQKIKAEGALQSKDFEFKRNSPGNWYEWKPAKRALEQLFMEGHLMVAKRQGFQKVYDITERVLPLEVDTTYPNEQEYAKYLITNAIRANGFVEEKEISYLRKGVKEHVKKTLSHLVEENKITEVEIAGFDDLKFYSTNDQLIALEKIKKLDSIQLLSPFDNAMIQRSRVQKLFNFDYVIECYLPESKRKFGYFSLPVLYKDEFVARLDPKADRASGIFYIRSLHFEKGFKPDDEFNQFFSEKLKQFATFNSCDEIVIEKADAKWKKAIKGFVK